MNARFVVEVQCFVANQISRAGGYKLEWPTGPVALLFRARGDDSHMSSLGTHVDETGTLVRDEGGFMLRRDEGGRYRLDMHRVPVDHVEKRVRVLGVLVEDDLVDVDGASPV